MGMCAPHRYDISLGWRIRIVGMYVRTCVITCSSYRVVSRIMPFDGAAKTGGTVEPC